MKRRVTALFLAGLLCAGTLSQAAFAAPQSESATDPETVANADFSETNQSRAGAESSQTGANASDVTGSTAAGTTANGTTGSTATGIIDNTTTSTTSDPELETELDSNDPAHNSKKDLILPDPGTVTGFEIMDPEEGTITLTTKCTMDELTDLMPETILVHLDHNPQAVEIPVTWVSEIDFETTNESYYIFWADWDKDMFPLTPGYGYEDYLPFVEVIVDSPVAYALGESGGITNIIARAREMVDIRWTPVRDVNGFSDPEDPLTVYYAGHTYNGIPYGQQVSSGTWVPHNTSFDTFLEAVANAASPMYIARGGYGNMNSTYYANDCSTFVSYCYGLPRMTTMSFGYSSQFSRVDGNSIYNAEVGDCFNAPGSHIEIITGMNYEDGNLVSVEVTEQTPPKARTIIYTPTRVQQLISSGYTLMRFNGRDTVAEPVGYSGYASDMENPVKVEYATEDKAELTIDDVNGDGSAFKITFAGAETYRYTKYTAAIWSNEGGQDDLTWVPLTRGDDGSYTANIRISDYKHKGDFILHLYKSNSRFNENFCIRKDAFTTEPGGGSAPEEPAPEQPAPEEPTPEQPAPDAPVTVEKISVTDFDNLKGTCKIVLSGVTAPSGVKKMHIPTWSNPKQADIIWYEAQKQDETTWFANMNIAKHQYNYGTYNIHVYGTNGNGYQNFCGKETVTFEKPETSVEAQVNGTNIKVTIKNIHVPAGVKSIVVPTWSSEKGQDDLIWENASYDAATSTATVKINAENYKHFGEFISHVYANDQAGKLVFIGKTSYTVAEPEYDYNEVTASYDKTTGNFTAAINYPKSAAGSISSVVIPIWSGSKQEDLIWYEASRTNANRWTISSNIRKHLGIGTYQCHVYGRVNGNLVFLGKTSFTASLEYTDFTVGSSKDGMKYPVSVTGLNSPIAFGAVRVAVWSEKNGQDDLVWYTLSGDGGNALKPGISGNFSTSIDITRHKTSGLYHVHLYGYTPEGKPVFIQRATLQVESAAKADIQVNDPVKDDGKVTLIIHVEDQDWTFTKLTVPTWCSPDQSDIFWYPAVKQSDGSWKVEVDKKNHRNHTGEYIFHTYADFSNGIFGFIGKTTADVA